MKECIDRADLAFQSADSGKELITTAIGSPATKTILSQNWQVLLGIERSLKWKYTINYGAEKG